MRRGMLGHVGDASGGGPLQGSAWPIKRAEGERGKEREFPMSDDAKG